MDLLNFAQVTYTTTTTSTDTGMSAVWIILSIVYAILWIVAMWKVFTKAGEHGWAAIVPFYNSYVHVKISGRNGWWFLLLLVPIVNIIFLLIISLDIAKAFGKSAIFGIFGLWIFSFIGYLLIGFGDAKYNKAKLARV